MGILLDAAELEPTELVQAFCEDHGIPEMEFQDLGIVQTWSCEDTDSGYQVSIDNNKNVTLQRP